MTYSKEKLRKWLKEPLVHFLVLGAILFLLFKAVNSKEEVTKETIRISSGTIHSITQNFQRVWNRPPTEDELQLLIDDYIKDEVFYREAVALGLDRTDPVIRRRLREKVQIMQEGMVDAIEPSENDLQNFLNQHPDRFKIESRYTFNQVYLNSEKFRNTSRQQIQKLVQELQAAGGTADASKFGDEFALGYYFSNTTESSIVRLFGQEFADQIGDVEQGTWSGPVTSKHGTHFVFVHDRQAGRIPALSEVRGDVHREWLLERQKKQAEEYYRSLKSRYEIVVERSPEDPTGKTS